MRISFSDRICIQALLGIGLGLGFLAVCIEKAIRFGDSTSNLFLIYVGLGAICLWGLVRFGRELYVLAKLHTAFFGKAPFKWHITTQWPYKVLKPLQLVVQQFPTITFDQIQITLHCVRERLKQRAKGSYCLIPYSLGVSALGTLHISGNLLYLPYLTELLIVTIGSVFLSGILYQNLLKLQTLFYYRLEEWALETLVCSVPQEKALSETILQTLLIQWVDGIEKLARLQGVQEKRHQQLQEILLNFAEKTQKLVEFMRSQHGILHKWVDEQLQSRHSMEKIAHRLQEGFVGNDDALKDTLTRMTVLCQEILIRLSDLPEGEGGQGYPDRQ